MGVDHVAGFGVRNPRLIAAAAQYGITIATCVPADPECEGGSEATVRHAKADLPTEANLLDAYSCWWELVEAGEALTAEVNTRPHRATHWEPDEAIVDEACCTLCPQCSTARRSVSPPSRLIGHHQLWGVTYSVPPHPGRRGGGVRRW